MVRLNPGDHLTREGVTFLVLRVAQAQQQLVIIPLTTTRGSARERTISVQQIHDGPYGYSVLNSS